MCIQTGKFSGDIQPLTGKFSPSVLTKKISHHERCQRDYWKKTWEKYLSEHKISPQIWYQVMYYPHVISEALFLPNFFIHYFVVQIIGTHIQSKHSWGSSLKNMGKHLNDPLSFFTDIFLTAHFQTTIIFRQNVCSSIEKGWPPHFSYNIYINARYVQKILSSFKVYNVGYMYDTGLQHRHCSITKIV